MKYLLDSNVYFAALRDERYYTRFRDLLARIMPRTWLSSVVQHELLRGARGDLGRTAIRRLTRALERVGRVVAPTAADWLTAAVARGRIWDEHPSLRTKVLQNDLLIACSARRIGALVVSENTADFAIIKGYLAHDTATLAGLALKL